MQLFDRCTLNLKHKGVNEDNQDGEKKEGDGEVMRSQASYE